MEEEKEEKEEKDEKEEADTQRGKRGQLPRKWRRANEADDWKRKELENRNFMKYKYVKFLELKKVNKRLKLCRKQVLEAMEAGKDAEVAASKTQLKGHLSDHEYITHYPKHLPYNSLFPPKETDASRRRVEEMRKVITEALLREQKEAEEEEGDDAEEEAEAEEEDEFFDAADEPKVGKVSKGKNKAKDVGADDVWKGFEKKAQDAAGSQKKELDGKAGGGQTSSEPSDKLRRKNASKKQKAREKRKLKREEAKEPKDGGGEEKSSLAEDHKKSKNGKKRKADGAAAAVEEAATVQENAEIAKEQPANKK